MPLYDYTCERCGSFETQRPSAEAGTPAECPECGGPAERQWSVPVVASNGQPTSFNGRKPRLTPPPIPSGSRSFRPEKKEPEASAAKSGDA
jgi:putative FmdB family regulatory protein